MPSLTELLTQNAAHAWLFLPVAILLGALHGLEPGHSKTMMAAFVIAIRGTVGQAVLLGLSAAISHTALVWIVALGGKYLFSGWKAEASEPYFQMASALAILAIAFWMIWRTWQDRRSSHRHHAHHRHHAADHDHHSHGHSETRRVDTDHGILRLEIFEDGVPPRWRIMFESGHAWPAEDVKIDIRRPDGTTEAFSFVHTKGYLESPEHIPEPHEFAARLSLGHTGHVHTYDLAFSEHDHSHGHHDAPIAALEDAENMDAHARAHAAEIERRFSGRKATTGQIVAFGLTGGLIPCPAAITVLLLCLQAKAFVLAVAVVFCFSLGVAATMVAAGVIAALGLRHIRKRWSGFDRFSSRAPYASAAVMVLVGLYMAANGWLAITGSAL